MKAFYGCLIQSAPENPQELQIMLNTLVIVNDTGTIEKVVKNCPDTQIHLHLNENPQEEMRTKLTTLTPSQFLIPGLIDTHIHAPQYQYTGTAVDLELMKWLNVYAFPAETACN
jgi:guanine deaminase